MKLQDTPVQCGESGVWLWHGLAGVCNNSIRKSARYHNETPARPDLPRREELEKTVTALP